MGFLIVPLAGLVGGAVYCADVAWHPWHACPRCSGRRGRGVGSTSRAWNRCGRCGGKGELVRPGARTMRRVIGRPID